MKSYLLLAVIVSFPLHELRAFPLEEESWETIDGKAFDATLLKISDEKASFRFTDPPGVFSYPIIKLSLESQQQIAEVAASGEVGDFFPSPIGGKLKASLLRYHSFGHESDMWKTHDPEIAKIIDTKEQVTWIDEGVLGGAIEFNGRNSTVKTGRLFPLQNQPFTISLWVKSEAQSEQDIISFGGETQGFSIYTNGRNIGFLYRWDNRKKFVNLRYSKDPVTDGRWHHVCASAAVDGAISLYVDSILAGQQNGLVISHEPKYGAFLGGVYSSKQNPRKAPGTRPFMGAMDELIIFGEAISARDVAEIYSSTLSLSRLED